MVTTNIPLLPKQADFIFDEDTDELLYSGAFRAGKSRALCLRAIRQAQHPKARVGLCRKRMTDLRRTTMRTLMEPVGDLPAVLPEGTYTHHKQLGNERIVIKGGGQIALFGCDDPQSIGSMEFTDLNIDEAAELDEEEWVMLTGRCSISFTYDDGHKHKPTMAAATNPEGPGHFLHVRFFQNPTKGFTRVIETTAFDNFFLPPAYVRRIGISLHGVARLRYLFGKWAGSEGLVYPMFDQYTHVKHIDGPWKYYIAGVDVGFTNPMVMRIHGVDGDGRSHVVASFYKSGLVDEEFADWCKIAKEHYNPITFIVDPSAAGMIATMKSWGFDVEPGENDVEMGIACVRNRFMKAEDGRPRLTFEPLYHTIDDAESPAHAEYLLYSLKKNAAAGKEVPLKENDHVPDADRYACLAIEKGIGGIAELLAILPSTTHRERYEEDGQGGYF